MQNPDKMGLLQLKLDSDDTYHDMRETDEVLPGTDLLYQALKGNNNKQMCSSLFCRGLHVFRINPGVIICPELLLGLSAACVLGGVAVTTENNFLPGYERILFHVRGRCGGENDLHHHPRVLAASQVCLPHKYLRRSLWR